MRAAARTGDGEDVEDACGDAAATAAVTVTVRASDGANASRIARIAVVVVLACSALVMGSLARVAGVRVRVTTTSSMARERRLERRAVGGEASKSVLGEDALEDKLGTPRGRDVVADAADATVKATGKGSFEYCVVQITTPANAESRSVGKFKGADSPAFSSTSYTHVETGGMNKDVMYSALAGAKKDGCRGQWWFIGDDDTLFYAHGIETWMTQRAPQSEWLVAHGNLYEPRKLEQSWFTGGSGMVLTNALVERVLAKYAAGELAAVNGAAFQQCRCFDVPFMRGVLESGARVFHQPNLFLDSCLNCNRRGIVGVPIVSCHAATIFRQVNPHASSKGGDDFEEAAKGLSYAQVEDFAKLSAIDRRTWFDAKCNSTK